MAATTSYSLRITNSRTSLILLSSSSSSSSPLSPMTITITMLCSRRLSISSLCFSPSPLCSALALNSHLKDPRAGAELINDYIHCYKQGQEGQLERCLRLRLRLRLHLQLPTCTIHSLYQPSSPAQEWLLGAARNCGAAAQSGGQREDLPHCVD